ncbi:hypothetical protein LOAG_08960 [Loa loa]|uniref:Uncharacterized protein n=1 Tax=Loa loa TaxID=7209 RepID=A0A1S0TSZ8_LOALO|nr:hypothetical protein LOAG_08960 [Loa loa]EFO19531.1 hypothetical protein LOAG_08960 [Loa loa]
MDMQYLRCWMTSVLIGLIIILVDLLVYKIGYCTTVNQTFVRYVKEFCITVTLTVRTVMVITKIATNEQNTWPRYTARFLRRALNYERSPRFNSNGLMKTSRHPTHDTYNLNGTVTT